MLVKPTEATHAGCPVLPPPAATHPGLLLQIISFILAYYQSIFIIILTILATIGAIYVAHSVSIYRLKLRPIVPEADIAAESQSSKSYESRDMRKVIRYPLVRQILMRRPAAAVPPAFLAGPPLTPSPRKLGGGPGGDVAASPTPIYAWRSPVGGRTQPQLWSTTRDSGSPQQQQQRSFNLSP